MLDDVRYLDWSDAAEGELMAGAGDGVLRDRQPVEHRVKSWPHLFQATLSGAKKHDLRRATERDYRVGDLLTLREFDPRHGRFTGREMSLRITYVTSAQFPCALSGDGLHADYCILSLNGT